MQKSPKILVIQTAFIGDVILSTAVAENLIKNYPNAQLDYLVRKGNEGLFDDHPYIQRIWVWNKRSGKYRSLLQLIFDLRKVKYDQVIVLQRFLNAGLLAGLSGGKEIIGFKKNPVSFLFDKKVPHSIERGIHEVDRNNKLIAHFCPILDRKPKLYPKKVAKIEIKAPYCTISPASVWFTKQFPEEQWIKLIDAIPNEHEILLLGGPTDQKICDLIQKGSKRRTGVRNLAGQLTLLESAAVMKNSSMNYVNDSAPMHLASAVNAPCTAIFCSTVPDFGFGPLSDHSVVVQSPEKLSCRPCGLHGQQKCPKGHFRCATSISTITLVDTLQNT